MKAFRNILLAFSVLTLAGPAPSYSAEKEVILKTPLPWPGKLPVLGEGLKYFADRIEKVSGGSIKMQMYEPGKLVPPLEILDAVSSGKVNSGFAVPANSAGKIPEGAVFAGLPFGPEADEFKAWLYAGNGMKLYQKMYDDAGYNVKVLLVGVIPPESNGWYTKEIKTPEDLKGLRMRFYGIGGKVMEKLGVSISLLPAGEIFPALEKGVLDATEFNTPAVDRVLGLQKVAKFNYFPGWHQPSSCAELLINKDVWKEMSEHQQAAIEALAGDTVRNMTALAEASQSAAMEQNEKDGVKNILWSDEMMKTFKKTWNDVIKEELAKDPKMKVIYDDLMAFREKYKIWGSMKTVPQNIDVK